MKSANLSESEPGGTNTPSSGHTRKLDEETVKSNASVTLRKISTAISTKKRTKAPDMKCKPPTANAVFHTDSLGRSSSPAPKIAHNRSRIKAVEGTSPSAMKIPLSLSGGSRATPLPSSRGLSSSSGETCSSASLLDGQDQSETTVDHQLKPHGARKMITFYVCTLMGTTYTMHLSPYTTVGQLKIKLNDEENIAFDSQILIFREKELLNEEETIEEVGIQSGSRIQLVTKMYGGPGANFKSQVSPEDTSVVFLLCKQNDEVFILEVQMDPIKGCKTTAKHVITLAEGTPGAELLKSLDSNECLDLGMLDEIFSGEETGSVDEWNELECPTEDCFKEADVEKRLEELRHDYIDRKTGTDRPNTSDSVSSASTFISFITPPEAIGDDTSRLTTAEKDFFPLGSLNKDLERLLLTDAEWKPPSSARSNPIFQIQSSRRIRSCKRRQRPATAISIMRLPPGTQSMLLIPKSRPASAEKVIQSLIGDPKAAFVCSAPVATASSKLTSLFKGLSSEWTDQDLGEYDSTTDQSTGIDDESCQRSMPKNPARRILTGRSTPTQKKTYELATKGPRETFPSDPNKLLEFQTGPRERKTISLKKKRPLSRISMTTETSTTSSKGIAATVKQSPGAQNSSTASSLLSRASRSKFQATILSSTAVARRSTNGNIVDMRPASRTSTTSRSSINKKAVGSPSVRRASSTIQNSPRRPSSSIKPQSGSKEKSSKSAVCFTCHKKLRVAVTFKCKCDHVFCSVHRYSDRHACSFNYKESGKAQLRKENPLVQKERVAKV